MIGDEKVKLTRVNDAIAFNGVEEAFSIDGLHVSPVIDGVIYFYLEPNELKFSLIQEDFVSMLMSLKSEKVTPTTKSFEISQIGLVYKITFDLVEIVNVADWSLQTMFTLVNGERLKLTIGPTCEYNDCVYFAIFPLNSLIYYLKVRFMDAAFESFIWRITSNALKNELIFNTLKKTFRLF
ncbi:hypothetical protein GWK48_01565 [Metallosphaera tengchongensis]|uniref:Uncharacterized protein n=1 Tax=Metallosphaera tengchongensis TaxID=1532350 RepID=A0A6N0NR89_9CREN|nr:hypothetical protein [Metallosphaera tengchongensis]QKQ99255.1 hypothetical protein GWK48_01565 [Metallosphaera tengchongensis]